MAGFLYVMQIHLKGRLHMDFITLLQAAVLGFVQGITEWLPISSTGHMILVDEFLKMNVSEAFMEMFLVVIQFGSILAVVALYFHKLNPFSPKKSSSERRQTLSLWAKVIVAVIPAGIVGVLLDDWFTEHFYNYQVVAVALIVYGILFIVLERYNRKRRPRITSVDQLDYKTALLIGVFDILPLIPGTSRSGSTILGGILVGASRSVAAEFSFFLAIPIMLGASLLKIVKFGLHFTALEWQVLIVGMVVAFLVSIIAIKFLMGYIRKHDFTAFGWYRIVLGLLVIVYFVYKSVAMA